MAAQERSLRVEAVVLRHSDWGEADRLLSLYTREAGKLRVVAKGVRKLRSRKAGHLEPFTRVALLLARGHDLWIVTQADTLDAYLPLREDLLRTGYASYVVELADRFSYEEGQNSGLYRLLVETLERVTRAPEEADIQFALRYYEIRMLDLLGHLDDTVWVGMSAGSMVMAPRIGEEFVGWKSPLGDRGLGRQRLHVADLQPQAQQGRARRLERELELDVAVRGLAGHGVAAAAESIPEDDRLAASDAELDGLRGLAVVRLQEQDLPALNLLEHVPDEAGLRPVLADRDAPRQQFG